MAGSWAGVAASFAGFSGVGLGAFGAHALKTYLKNKNMMEVWHTGVQYHLIHSVALLGIVSVSDLVPDAQFDLASPPPPPKQPPAANSDHGFLVRLPGNCGLVPEVAPSWLAHGESRGGT